MGEVDEILCAGDMVYEYRFSNPVVDVLRQRGIKTVLGNHEEVILSQDGQRMRRDGVISPENLAFLNSLPKVLETRLDGKRVYMVHGSPWPPEKEYLYPSHPYIPRLAKIDADVVILGHTHYPMIRQVGGVLVINPGSCGEARDPRHDFRLTYAIMDTSTGEAVIRSFVSPDEGRGWGEETAPQETEEGEGIYGRE